MDKGAADNEDYDKVRAFLGYPAIAQDRVAGGRTPFESFIRSGIRPLPSLRWRPLTESRPHSHYQQEAGPEIGPRGNEGTDLDGFGSSESSDEYFDAVAERTSSHEHDYDDSGSSYSPESTDEQSEDGGEWTAPHDHENDDPDPIKSSESIGGQLEEVAKGTGPRGNESCDSDPLNSPESPDDQSGDADSTTLSPNGLMGEVLEYLQHSMLDAVYGDFLSVSRGRRYEPKWPMKSGDIETPLHQPARQEEAYVIFDQLFRPLRGWHRLSESTDPVEARSQQNKILAILEEHRQKRASRPPPETCSGNSLLYRNLPDAATEVTVWSLINSAHVAIRLEQWGLAEQRVNEAIVLADELSYKPLISKCWYWRGMIMGGVGVGKFADRKAAAECFLEAMHCVGVYQEGELLSKAVAEYKHEMLELLEEQKAIKGEDKWSQQVKRAILGIDGWFQPLNDLPRPLSSSSFVSSPPRVPVPGHIHRDIDVNNASLELEPSSEEQLEESLNRFNRYNERHWFNEALLRPRNIDWVLVGEIEEAAEKSTYVQKETLYRLCKGLSPLFEEIILAETFTEGFDNYPDIEESVAWKVLNYTRVKEKLKRPRRVSEESPAPNRSVGTVNGLTKTSTQLQVDEPVGTHDEAVEQTFHDRFGRGKRGAPLKINTGEPKHPVFPSQTSSRVIRRTRRAHITAEEKIAAFEHNLLREEDDGEGNPRLRQELENNPGLLNDINEQRANFDQHVQQEMAASKVELTSAQELVRRRNDAYLEEIWGVRPRTPSPTEESGTQERKATNEQSHKLFKAEFAHMNYRRKYDVYARLPLERKKCTAEPICPSATIAWLEQETEKMSLGSDKLFPATASTSDGNSSVKAHNIGNDSTTSKVRKYDDIEGHISPIPPLLPHQRPSSTFRAQLGGERSPKDVPTSSVDRICSRANLQKQADISRLLDRPIGRQLKARIGMDAMSQAMEEARLNGKQISTKQLVRIGETAIGWVLSPSSSSSSAANGKTRSPLGSSYIPANGRDNLEHGDMSGVGANGTDLMATSGHKEDKEKVLEASVGNMTMHPTALTNDGEAQNHGNIPRLDIIEDSEDHGWPEDGSDVDWSDEDKELAGAPIHAESPSSGPNHTTSNTRGRTSSTNLFGRATMANPPAPGQNEQRFQPPDARGDMNDDGGADDEWEDDDEQAEDED